MVLALLVLLVAIGFIAAIRVLRRQIDQAHERIDAVSARATLLRHLEAEEARHGGGNGDLISLPKPRRPRLRLLKDGLVVLLGLAAAAWAWTRRYATQLAVAAGGLAAIAIIPTASPPMDRLPEPGASAPASLPASEPSSSEPSSSEPSSPPLPSEAPGVQGPASVPPATELYEPHESEALLPLPPLPAEVPVPSEAPQSPTAPALPNEVELEDEQSPEQSCRREMELPNVHLCIAPEHSG